MYIPNAFRETDDKALLAFVRANSFGMLLSVKDGQPFGSHIPFLIEERDGKLASLVGHVARANPHWQDASKEALAVFIGPHAYISPTWYEDPRTVPTWNYVAVHVRGSIEWLQDGSQIELILKETVRVYEAGMPNPWAMNLPDDFKQAMIKNLVGFRIEVKEVLGKWKLSQNHSRERREKAIEALKAQNDSGARDIAGLMQETLNTK